MQYNKCMNKKFVLLSLLITIFLTGCKSDFSNFFYRSYPKTPKGVTKAFVREIEKGNFEKAKEYTYNINLNGASFQMLQDELIRLEGKTFIYPVDRKDKEIVLDARGQAYNRIFYNQKINNQWKIISTEVDEDIKFKDLNILIMSLQTKYYYTLLQQHGYKKVKNLADIFSGSRVTIKRTHLKSIFHRSIDLKVYRKGTNSGALIRAYGFPTLSEWKWRVVKTF